MSHNQLSWRRVFEGCYHGFRRGEDPRNPAAILERNGFGRRLWSVYIVGRGTATYHGWDCFALRYAKRLAACRVFKADDSHVFDD